MRLTRRGRRLIMVLALLFGCVAGMTAQHWDPYTRAVDVQVATR